MAKARVFVSRFREAGLAYALLLPSLIFFAAFTYWPILRSIYFSFHDVMLGDSKIFFSALKTTCGCGATVCSGRCWAIPPSTPL